MATTRMSDGLAPSDHRLSFRQGPEGCAVCLVCARILTAAELGKSCPGLAARPDDRQQDAGHDDGTRP